MTENTKPQAIRLNRPAPIPETFENIAKQLSYDFCDVSGFGSLDWLEVSSPNGDEDTIRLEGPFDLLNITGRLRVAGSVVFSEYMCQASRHTDNGIQVLGGRLVQAQATVLELTYTPLTATEDAQLDEDSLPETKPAIPPSPKAGTQNKQWAKVMEESKRLEKKGRTPSHWEEEEEDSIPELGDMVKHRQFGDCKVVKVSDDHISLQKPDGRVVQLGLPILKFDAFQKDGSKTIWNVSVKR